VVVALKSRTAPVMQAVGESRAVAGWLRAGGAQQIYLKVCSTFDSTPAGNIGPVAEALAEDLQASFVPVAPAFPENGRTVFMGHLFVGDQLLSDSPMRHHPLTPMTDANLVRVLQLQRSGGQTGLVGRPTIAKGAAAVAARFAQLQAKAIDPRRATTGADLVAEALEWAADRLGDRPILVYATAEPQAVRAVQSRLGAGASGTVVETTLARITAGLVAMGVGRRVVAGGETSGALHLALKSGNFGGPDFFARAFAQLMP
jgi:uncharacterized protein YgbK (DUF1537 family)